MEALKRTLTPNFIGFFSVFDPLDLNSQILFVQLGLSVSSVVRRHLTKSVHNLFHDIPSNPISPKETENKYPIVGQSRKWEGAVGQI